jgi:hypothetical protein
MVDNNGNMQVDQMDKTSALICLVSVKKILDRKKHTVLRENEARGLERRPAKNCLKAKVFKEMQKFFVFI